MTKIKNSIGFVPVVETISRKFALRKETCSEKTVGQSTPSTAYGKVKTIEPHIYMGSVGRKQTILGYGEVTRNYFFMRKNANKNAASTIQRQTRVKFGAVSKWVAEAMLDLNAFPYNQQQFLACKADLSKSCSGIGVSGFTSMRNWMFAVAADMYGPASEPQTLPENHKIPAAE